MKSVSSCLVFLLFAQQSFAATVCPEGFVEDASGVCSPIQNFQKTYKGLGESCELSSECDFTKNFECLQGTCQCNPSTSILQARTYKDTQGINTRGIICSVQVGGSCSSSSQRCVPGAVCAPGNICTCSPPFTLTADNQCGAPFGSRCSSSQVCSDNLMCGPHGYHTNLYESPQPAHAHMQSYTSHSLKKRMAYGGRGGGYTSDGYHANNQNQKKAGAFTQVQSNKVTAVNNKATALHRGLHNRRVVAGSFGLNFMMLSRTCQCNPKYQTYDEVAMTCKSVIGSPCDSTRVNASSQCVSRGVCVPETGVCECEAGFVENMLGRCDIAYGQKCDKTQSMESLGTMRQFQFASTCDQAAQLVCKRGICACSSEFDVYDAEKRECAAKKGARCVSDESCQSGMRCIKKNTKIFMGRCGA